MNSDLRSSRFWSVFVVLTMVFFILVNFVWTDESYRLRTIDGDGRGYYSYLPTLFINHTVDFKTAFEHEKENQPLEYQGHNFHYVNGVCINKFSVGSALMILPFFALAMVLSPLFELPPDGYSLLFQYETALAALWWLWVGIFFFRKLMQRYNFSEPLILWSSVMLIAGTNLFHYAFVDVAFSHIYSFAAISAFLYFVKQLFTYSNRKYLVASAFLLGLVVLIRPVNGLIVFVVPFMADDYKTLKATIALLSGSLKNWLIVLLFFLLGVMPQLIINYLQTGIPIIYGYKGEGFYFLHPHITEFLFGYRKGWFIYTPFMLLIVPALWALYRRSKYRFVTFVSFLVLLVYLFSSWWNWFYGDGFGMRPMVDYYALFVLVIVLWVSKLTSGLKKVILLFSFIFMSLNLIQSYQYFKGIIHVDSMTKKAYWHQFLKVSDEYRNVVASADEYFYGSLAEKPILKSLNSFETNVRGWSNTKSSLTTSFYKSPIHSQQFDKEVKYSASFQEVVNDTLSNKRLYLILKAFYLEPAMNAVIDALFVIDVRNKDNKLVFYKASPLKRLPDDVVDKWQPAHIGILMPVLHKGDRFKTYIWNKKKGAFLIDDMEVYIYEIY